MLKIDENSLQVTKSVAKLAEQGGAAAGTSLGVYQLIVEHKDIIIIMCSVTGIAIALLGYVTTSLIDIYFKRKHLKLAELQIRRKSDKLT